MPNIPITLTLFAAKMIEEDLEAEKQKLAREFQEASEDVERNAEIEIWDTISYQNSSS